MRFKGRGTNIKSVNQIHLGFVIGASDASSLESARCPGSLGDLSSPPFSLDLGCLVYVLISTNHSFSSTSFWLFNFSLFQSLHF